jgi:hypothetical protein
MKVKLVVKPFAWGLVPLWWAGRVYGSPVARTRPTSWRGAGSWSRWVVRGLGVMVLVRGLVMGLWRGCSGTRGGPLRG